MSKSKSNGVKAAKPEKDVLSKAKNAGVTKPAQTVKSKSKDLAKAVATKKEDKKSKKKAKEPTPEPESDSSESEEESEDSESSESESESEAEAKPKTNGSAKINGTVPKPADSESESDSDSEEEDSESESDESEDEKPAPKAAVAKKVAKAESESDSDSEEESDESEEETAPAKAKASKAEEGSDSDEDSEDDSESSKDDSEEEEEKTEAPAKKRKAEDEESPFAAKKKKAEEGAAVSTGTTNLFVGNLSWNVDEQWLTQEFEEYGELSGVRIVTDRDSGRSKGFGYVEYVNAADAAKAYAAKKGYELDGRAINLDWATGRTNGAAPQRAQDRAKSFGDKTSPPSETLFLGNLSFEVTQDIVSEAFAEYGTVTGVRLPTDRDTGAPKGFGYVTYSSVDEAKAAFEAMQGYDLTGRPLRLDYSSPRPSTGDSPRGGRGGGRGSFGGRGGGRGGFGGRGGAGGRGGSRGGRPQSFNRGGFGDFSGKKTSFN